MAPSTASTTESKPPDSGLSFSSAVSYKIYSKNCDNDRFAAELHIVHYNSRYDSAKEALNHHDGLAVLGILFDVNVSFQSAINFSTPLTNLHFAGQRVRKPRYEALGLRFENAQEHRKQNQMQPSVRSGDLHTKPHSLGLRLRWIVDYSTLLGKRQMDRFVPNTNDQVENCKGFSLLVRVMSGDCFD